MSVFGLLNSYSLAFGFVEENSPSSPTSADEDVKNNNFADTYQQNDNNIVNERGNSFNNINIALFFVFQIIFVY